MLERFIKDTFVYGAGTLLGRALAFLLLPVYARVFGPAEYGVIEILSVLGVLVNIVVSLEISQGVAIHFSGAASENEKTGYASSAFWFLIAAFSLFAGAGVLFSGPLSRQLLGSESLEQVFAVAILMMAANAIFLLLQNQLRWQLQSASYTVVGIVYAAISAVGSIMLVLTLEKPLLGAFIGPLIGATAAGVLAFFWVTPRIRLQFSWPACRQMLAFSLPLVPSSIAVFISLYIDRFAIKTWLTMADLGAYGVAYRLASVAGLFIAGFQGALTPLVYAHHQHSSTPESIAAIFRLFLLPALLLILGLAVFSRELVILVATNAYLPAAAIIAPLAAAILLSNMYVFAPGPALARKTHLIALSNVLAAAVGVGLMFALVPRYGIGGAAAASLASAAAGFALHMTFSQRLYPVPHPWGRIFIAVAAVLVAGVVVQRATYPAYSAKIFALMAAGIAIACLARGREMGRLLAKLKVTVD
jgi:O-antigen/teichoic acid export membrane protein